MDKGEGSVQAWRQMESWNKHTIKDKIMRRYQWELQDGQGTEHILQRIVTKSDSIEGRSQTVSIVTDPILFVRDLKIPVENLQQRVGAQN